MGIKAVILIGGKRSIINSGLGAIQKKILYEYSVHDFGTAALNYVDHSIAAKNNDNFGVINRLR